MCRKSKYFVALLIDVHLPPQALQALGFVLSGDGDVDSLSSDEKSDGEGKTDRMSSSSSSIASSTDTQEVRSILRLSTRRTLQLEGTPQEGTGVWSSWSSSGKHRTPWKKRNMVCVFL